jgi:hypothetical protein
MEHDLESLLESWQGESDAKEWAEELGRLKIRSIDDLLLCAKYDDSWEELCRKVSLLLRAKLRNWIEGYTDSKHISLSFQ